jgi:hypothetical protein
MRTILQGVKPPSVGYFRCAIWIRFPQVSSNTAVITGPIWAGYPAACREDRGQVVVCH